MDFEAGVWCALWLFLLRDVSQANSSIYVFSECLHTFLSFIAIVQKTHFLTAGFPLTGKLRQVTQPTRHISKRLLVFLIAHTDSSGAHKTVL